MLTCPRLLFFPGLTSLLLSGGGCYLPSEEFDENEVTGPHDDDDAPDDGSYNVVEYEAQDQSLPCELDDTCWKDYLGFLDEAWSEARPTTEEELAAQIDAVSSGLVPSLFDPLPPDELRADLMAAMNVGFLRDGINGRLLEVTTTNAVDAGSFTIRRLLFRDEYVGTFEGLLLMPKGEGPFPGVVAIHGHFQSAAQYVELSQGSKYPKNGYALLALSMRADNADWVEDLVTTSLLLDGFTFMALRHYETILALKYLRYLPAVDPGRIGLIGHSGGSVASNLTIRIEPGFVAYTSDCRGIYVNGNPGELIDETAPDLFPFHQLVNDFTTSETPILDVPYDHAATPEGIDEILEFFDDYV